MAIFGRRRASSNPRPSTTSISSAATLAASQAFLANKASNANISSAAATAALRAHTPIPTPVGEIQTKRMQRRSSITSQASAPGGTPMRPGGLQRRDSSGSMTERTFRSPSPNAPQDRHDRPASSHGPYPRCDRDEAPPVPALPKNYASAPLLLPMSNRRPASAEPPQRVISPPPRQSGGRGVSLDRGPGVMSPPQLKRKQKKALDSVDELDPVDNRNSVNFSRPLSPQNSAPTSPLAGGQIGSPPSAKPAPSTGLANGEEDQSVASIRNGAITPANKKKKEVATKGSAECSHVATDTSGGLLTGVESDMKGQRQASSTTSTLSSSTGAQAGQTSETIQPRKKVKRKKRNAAAQSGESQPGGESIGAGYPSDTDSVISERNSTSDRPRSFNTRAAGLLAMQPSTVREDREGEQQAEERLMGAEIKASAVSNGRAVASTPANTSKLVSKDRQHGRSPSQQTPTSTPKLELPSGVRPASLSPGRAAHFSAQPVNEGTKHQPPGRSVSPAKSALKNSPSRGSSPIIARRGLAPSDASDSASQYSDDASKSSGKRKKSARVSFDAEAVVVGRAASPPLVPESPLLMSPQNKSAKTRTWIDLIREKNQESIATGRDEDSAIKPTPALPSFGTIRGREPKSLGEVPGQLTLGEDWAKDTMESMNTSTDATVGHILAADTPMRQTKEGPPQPAGLGPNDPLPPQVTSVEGSGYHSDEGDLFDDEKKAAPFQPDHPLQQSNNGIHNDIEALQSAPIMAAAAQTSAHAPSIAVQPATPGLDSTLGNRDSWLGMPGEFPFQKEGEREPTSNSDSADHHTPATIGIAEPEPEAVAAQHQSSSRVVGEVAQKLRTQIDAASGDESDDTAGDSIYSDAAEDQSDLEGDGFGSINAIVESPTSPNIPLAGKSPPGSPGKATREKFQQPGIDLSEPASAEGWDRAQAYWSGLSQTRKQQLEQAALPGAIDEPIIQNRSMRGADAVHKKKKTKRKTPQPLNSNNFPPQTSTSVASLKSSMRSSSPQSDSAPHLRSSMRSGALKLPLNNSDQLSSSNSKSSPKAALQKKTRPVSTVALVDYKRTAQTSSRDTPRAVSATALLVSKNSLNVEKKNQFPSKIQRANSDSDSSFKKARPKTPDGSRYTMKRSMRGQSSEPMPNRASSMAARTVSPTDSLAKRPFSSVGTSGAGGMRTSMRGPVDVSKPGLSFRNSLESGKARRTKSPSRFSFMGSSKPKSVTTESKPTSRFSSRFGDSSDEDGLPTTASSRFGNSSDDDVEPAGLTPVRGIPRRTNDGESTDLDDSSEEKGPGPTGTQAEANRINSMQAPAVKSLEGVALPTGSLRPPIAAIGNSLQAKKAAEREKKKRSLFGSLTGRKRDESSRTQKSDVESPTRRDAPLERTKAERMTIIPESSNTSGRILGPSSPAADPVVTHSLDTASQAGSQGSTAQNSPKSPKLRRRNTPKKPPSSNDISWPLSQAPADNASTPSRPRTSDGPTASNVATRPSLVLRHSVQAPVRSPVANGMASASIDPIAKKKKFSMLRKAFGLPS